MLYLPIVIVVIVIIIIKNCYFNILITLLLF